MDDRLPNSDSEMLINHVTSADTRSGIFEAIFDYFREHAPESARVLVTKHPDPSADVHHYHRCHLEVALTDRAVCTVHHDLFDPDPWVRLEKFMPRYREARLVICLNRGQKDFLTARGVKHTAIVPHGYNDKVLHPKAMEPRDYNGGKITLGVISKYYERRFKGEAYLHDLVKRLSPEDFQFILVGERRLRTAESLSRLGFRVRLFELLPYRLFQSLYESIDYLLMCSTFEGGPANLSEAMATHTPIIATPVGYAPDFVEDGQTGLLLTGNVEQDARQLNRLRNARDPLTAALRRGAPLLRARCPTWREVVSRHIELYRTVREAA